MRRILARPVLVGKRTLLKQIPARSVQSTVSEKKDIVEEATEPLREGDTIARLKELKELVMKIHNKGVLDEISKTDMNRKLELMKKSVKEEKEKLAQANKEIGELRLQLTANTNAAFGYYKMYETEKQKNLNTERYDSDEEKETKEPESKKRKWVSWLGF